MSEEQSVVSALRDPEMIDSGSRSSSFELDYVISDGGVVRRNESHE